MAKLPRARSTKVTSLPTGIPLGGSSGRGSTVSSKRVYPKKIATSIAGVGTSSGASYHSLVPLRYRDNLNQASYHNQGPPVSRGVTLAQEFFDIYDYGDEAVSESSDYETIQTGNKNAEPCWWPQMELALETNQELQTRLHYDIARFERAYDKMALSAVRWKQLMEDVESNPQIKKMFKDMQLMRRLSGSEFE